MALDSVRVRWVEAGGQDPPSARCGHIAVAVDSRDCWQQEFLIVHGGIDVSKEALDDLHVLQCEQETWFSPERAALGPAARAFHAAAVIGRRVYIFGGHVYVRAQQKLHQFSDLWCLNTDSWEWTRMDASPELPHPCPRDRAAMVALSPNRLLVYGGADSQNKRLDDAWVFDLEAITWTEVKPVGPRPRGRCCTTLFPLEQRVLLFAGDTSGVNNELWSLRGLQQDGEQGLPAWTQLLLEGPQPPPRRGHAVAGTGRWVVFVGGLSEQKSMLGMKSKNEYLSDVVILDRRVDKVTWRSVESDTTPPVPREKHTLTALSGGRLLLFGGTDGQTTLGDAWWLDLEDDITSPPHVVAYSDLPPSAASRDQRAAAAAAAAQAPAGSAQGGGPAAGPGAGAGLAAPPRPAAAAAWGGSGAADAGGSSSSTLTGSLAYLSTALPAVPLPAGLSSAFMSLRGRLGLPTTASASALAAAQQAASVAASEQHDEALLHLGERVLAAESSSSRSSSGGASVVAGGGSAGSPDAAALVRAARHYLACSRPEDLRVGELPMLMSDYRRLARVGWSMVIRERGLDGVLDPATQMPGRFLHVPPGELRVKEVAEVLADYQLLLAAAAGPASAALPSPGRPPA